MKEAPARISMIMQVTRVVPITLSQKDLAVSTRPHHAMASDPSTPHAAHSVAVAQPMRSAANIRRISSVSGMRLADSRSFSRMDICGSGGGILALLTMDQAAI